MPSNACGIVPKPESVECSGGVFEIKRSTRIRMSSDARDIGVYLQNLLRPATVFPLEIIEDSDARPKPDTIGLTLSEASPSLGDEGYELTASSDAVMIRALKPAGLFYGVQTLRQLLPPEIEMTRPVSGAAWRVPAVRIQDRPRFRWRGLMLDVARHLFPVDFIKRYIDVMALHKMNVFHWHLTDDQGWRVEIRKYPKLVEIGSRRAATPVAYNRERSDDKPYAGYYTREKIRDIVAYAAGRFVTVVPEIEMPGHAMAVLAGHPELGCTGGPYQVRTKWGVEEDVFCAGNERVYTFLEDVLGEALDLFPGEFIHIGGDECPKARWKQCPKCREAIRRHGLKDEDELQSHFIRRIGRFLSARGRRMIGWDEILEGGLAPNAAVMSWRNMEGGIQAAREGHDAVMSPKTHCYFDYYQSQDVGMEPPAIGGCLPLETVYAFEPVPSGLSPGEAAHIIGVQGNLWTEYMATPEKVEYMTFPRASALAEVAWSPPGLRDAGDFSRRLDFLLRRMENLGVNCRR
ncbi:MAG: beta-N-acetylhexosaminidase [Planctomycetota bacterium]